jgi:hypothetical protein
VTHAGTGAGGGDGMTGQHRERLGADVGPAATAMPAGGPAVGGTAPPSGHPRPARPPYPGYPPYSAHPGPHPAPHPGPHAGPRLGPHSGPHAVPAPRAAPSGPQPSVPGGYGRFDWDPADDVEDPRPVGNPAAATSVVLGVLAVLVALRPLAFGSMAMAWDTYVALGVAVVALVVGGAGLRGAVRRPVAIVGMVLAVAALLVVAVLPTL